MRHPLTAMALILVGMLALGLYQLKYEVVRLEERKSVYDRSIAEEREAIQVLNAEWSYLNRPQRLDELAKRHLDLVPVAVGQLGAIDELAMRYGQVVQRAEAIPLPKPRPGSQRRDAKWPQP